MYKFFKYRHNFSYRGDEWEYKMFESEFLDNKDELESLAESVAGEYNWSEHYRGLEYSVVDEAPEKWLKDKLIWEKKALENYKKRVEFLTEKLREIDANNGHHSV